MPKRSTVATETLKPGFVPTTEADFHARLTAAYEAGAASVAAPSTPDAPDPTYVQSCDDACDEGVYRLAFVIEMLHAAEDRPSEADDTGGFEFHIIREALEAIRTMLHASSQAAEAKARTAASGAV